jgi:hypothetical protein
MRARDARSRTRGRLVAALTLTLVGALLALSATALGAPVPGTPDPVAAGVPGYGRAWELVTPPDVTPARVAAALGGPPLIAVSTTGDRVAYRTVSAMPDASYGALFAFSMAERGPEGWTSTPLELPYPELSTYGRVLFEYEGPLQFDPELRTSIWGNDLPAPASGLGLFVREADSTYLPLGRIGSGEGAFFLGASSDLRRVFFKSNDHLLPADATRTEGSSIYEISNSELHLVDVKDDGTLLSTCGSSPLFRRSAYSSDGLRVFFVSKPACGAHERVYLRAGGHTTEISASQCTLPDPECGPEQDVHFVGATASGSVAYIATAQRLTNDDTNEYQDLYRYDAASGDLTLLTPRSAASTASPPEFLVKPSSDGSRAYFAASGQLIPGEGTVEGTNLYLADSQGLHFIAPISGSERFNISADGRYVLFQSPAKLVADDSDESDDVYRYDADTGKYLRVSAGLDGAGNGPFQATLPEGPTPDVGREVFFTTSEPLLPQDHNEAEDVYEWTEAGGLGLVSAGTPGFGAEYLGATEDGRTVLIRTGATLLPRDRDGGEMDIYAARVGGGFPEPVAPAGCGSGGACEAVSAGTPHRTLPGAEGRKPFIGIAPISAATLRQLVGKGSTTLLVEVPAAGRLTAQGRARVGAHVETVASGGAVAKAAGPLRLRLRLTKLARRSLAQGRALRVQLVLHLPAQNATAKDSFTLRRTR